MTSESETRHNNHALDTADSTQYKLVNDAIDMPAIAHRTYAFAVRTITLPDEVKVDVLAPVDRVTDPPNLLPLPPVKLIRPPSEDADRPAPPTTFTGPAACARRCAWSSMDSVSTVDKPVLHGAD